jgi:hypothetical protein
MPAVAEIPGWHGGWDAAGTSLRVINLDSALLAAVPVPSAVAAVSGQVQYNNSCPHDTDDRLVYMLSPGNIL